MSKQETALSMLICLEKNDPKGFLRILNNYLYFDNRHKLVRKAKLAKQTAYTAFSKKGNPKITTLAQITYDATQFAPFAARLAKQTLFPKARRKSKN